MRYLNCIILLFACFLSTLSFAQAVAGEPNQYESSWRLKQIIRDKLNTQERSNPIDYSEIKGTPYINEQFVDGQYFLDGESQGHFYLRYNVYNDQIEILVDATPENLNGKDPKFDVYLKFDNSMVMLNGKIIKSYYYNDEHGNSSNSYFIEVNKTDKISLLLRKRCVLTPAEKAATPNQADRAAKFTIYDDYYLLLQNETYPRKIELKKRKLLKEFPKYELDLKAFMKQENINLNQEDDLIKLTNYLSTLAL
jgi:hypothetical protein